MNKLAKKQECIPVGYVPPALPPYRGGGLHDRAETPLDRDPHPIEQNHKQV